MMKKIICIFPLCVLLFMSACTAERPQDDGAADKSYYGTWRVEKLIATTPISALSADEIDALVGQTLIYKQDGVWSGAGAYVSPIYKETELTGEEFEESFRGRPAFADLGFPGPTVTAVTATDCALFGGDFYIKGQDALVIQYNGGFFEAVRTEA